MHAQWYESIEDVGADRIAPLAGSPVDFSYGVTLATERSLWGDLQVRYLCIERERTVLAFTPVYYGTNIEFMAVMPDVMRRSYHALVEHGGLSNAYTGALVGCLISDRGWIPLLPECDQDAVVDLVIASVDAFCRENKMALCVYKDINQAFPAIERFRAHGLVETHSLPSVRVDTDFASKEDYINSLTANGRSHARRTLKKAAKEFTIAFHSDYEPLIERAYPLWRATYLKAPHKFEELSPTFFRECARVSPPESELITCERGDKLVGVFLLFWTDDQQLNKRIGIDYSEKKTGLVYTALNYHSLLRGIERGIKMSYLGQTSYTPKVRMGGDPEDQYLFLKGYKLSVRAGFPIQRRFTRQFRAEVVREQVKNGTSPS